MPWAGSRVMIIPSAFIHKALHRPFEHVGSSASQVGDSVVLPLVQARHRYLRFNGIMYI